MPDPAITKIEDRAAEILQAYANAPGSGLAGWTIIADPESDVSIDPDAIVIYTTGYSIDQSDEQNQSRHTATLEFEAVTARSAAGTISRRNQAALAHVLAAIAADRTFGGMIEDIQEVDVAPVEAASRSSGAASLQCALAFYTPRDDWFTIVGIGGTQF